MVVKAGNAWRRVVSLQWTFHTGSTTAASPAIGSNGIIYVGSTDSGAHGMLHAIGASDAQGIIVTNTPCFAANRAKLVQFAASQHLPAMYFFKLFVDAGGLMSYGGSLGESYRRAATYVDKILKGAKPADLPVERSTKFDLVINLKTAQALGLTMPPALLKRADEVIR